MADTAANPFDAIDPDTPEVKSSNPFDAIGGDIDAGSQTSAFGSFLRGAERSILPALGSLPAAGAGAEAGAGIGALTGPAAPVAVPAGAIIGGIAGAVGGSTALATAQHWALSKLPSSWTEAIGMDDRQERLDEQQHGTASFLGGLAPYALTLRPGAGATASLPANATAFQRIMANPVTARVFGGTVQGGMELGNETVQGQKPNWTNIAVATGFGVVFNRPNRLGQRLTDVGANASQNLSETVRGAPSLELPATNPQDINREAVQALTPAPTVMQAADAKVMGPGITEAVFQGAHEMAPDASIDASNNAAAEAQATGSEWTPDVHALARRLDPETFTAYDTAASQYDEFKAQVDRLSNPPPEDVDAAAGRVTDLQKQLDDLTASQNGFLRGDAALDARRLRANIRDAQNQHDDLLVRQQAWSEGTAQQTPELALARQRLVQADEQMRELVPQLSAARSRAAEMLGRGEEFEEPEGTPVTAEAQVEGSQIPEEPVLPGTEAATEPPIAGNERATSPVVDRETSNGVAQVAATRPIEDQRAFIQGDVSRQLQAAGRPTDEAEAQGQLVSAYYETRAARFGGTKGSAEDLYRSEFPTVRSGDAKAPKALELAQKTGKSIDLAQAMRGKIRVVENARNTITLMRDADASTFTHEMGHQWLEDLLSDASDERAPQQLRDDAAAVRKWLGMEEGAAPKRGQHERFARGTEQYLRAGVAPSKALARVFAQFRTWLTTIYSTLQGLGKPISEDIRSVFDRMLATEPERTTIMPEMARGPTLADVHEVDARHTDPEEAGAAYDRVLDEMQRGEQSLPPEIQNELAAAAEPIESAPGSAGDNPADGRGEGGREQGGPGEVGRAGEQSEPVGPSGTGGAQHAAVGSGSGATGTEGAGVGNVGDRRFGLDKSGSGAIAPGPAEQFGNPDERFVDKAGNIVIDNLTSLADIAEAIRGSAERNDDFQGVRGSMTKGQMLDLAESMNLDPQNINEAHLAQLFGSTGDLGAKILAARLLVARSGAHVVDLMAKAADGTDADLHALSVAIARHDMIQATLSGVTAEWGRAGNAFHSLVEGFGTAQNLNELLKKNLGRDLFQLKLISKMGKNLDTPGKVSKFLRDAQKRNFGRMLLEYWINGLISGPATHTTYMVGNTILAIEKAGPETAAAAGIGAIRSALGREGTSVRLGEVGAQLRGAVKGLPGAVEASLEAFRSGMTTMLPGETVHPSMPFAGDTSLHFSKNSTNEDVAWRDVGAQAFGLVRGARDGILSAGALLKGGVPGSPLARSIYSPLGQIPDVAIRGVVLPLGSAARLPSRFIAAIHSFYRGINYSMAKSALAYRHASDEGLTGTAFDARVGDLRANPTDEMMEESRGSSTELTLMGTGGNFTQAMSRLTNTEVFGFPLLKFIDPFVHIASNIIEQSLVERTPLGILSKQIRTDLAGARGETAAAMAQRTGMMPEAAQRRINALNAASDTAAAKMAVGTVIGIAFGSLAAEGLMSGSGPSDPRKGAMWRLAGNQAHSVRIGDTWYDIARLGPMGMLAGVAADLYGVSHQIGKEDASVVATTIAHAFAQNILDESFMRGPADLMQALEDPERYGASYVRTFLSSFTPYSVGMAQVARAVDPYSRQSRTIMDAIKAKIPGESETLLPRRDIWGEPMPSYGALIAPGVTAIYETRMSQDPVNLAMAQLGMGPAQPTRKIRNVQLTDQQYDDYCRIAGRMAKMRLDTIVRSPDFTSWSQEMQMHVINETITQSRETARGIMMMKYPTIPAAAAQQKLAALVGNNP